jgi:hypothetical protein
MNDVLGTVFYSALVYVLGALTGMPLYTWLKSKMPWSHK